MPSFLCPGEGCPRSRAFSRRVRARHAYLTRRCKKVSAPDRERDELEARDAPTCAFCSGTSTVPNCRSERMVAAVTNYRARAFEGDGEPRRCARGLCPYWAGLTMRVWRSHAVSWRQLLWAVQTAKLTAEAMDGTEQAWTTAEGARSMSRRDGHRRTAADTPCVTTDQKVRGSSPFERAESSGPRGPLACVVQVGDELSVAGLCHSTE